MKQKFKIILKDSGRELVRSLEIAVNFQERFKGLMGRQTLSPGDGLVLIPCSSIHTGLMRFAIDIVMIDREARVVDVRPHVRPWRILFGNPGTYAVLELAAGEAEGIQEGDRLQIQPASDRPEDIPRQARFLA